MRLFCNGELNNHSFQTKISLISSTVSAKPISYTALLILNNIVNHLSQKIPNKIRNSLSVIA